MKKILALWILSFTLIFPQTAEEIVEKAEDAIKGETSHAVFEMIIHKPDFTRTLKLESWWKGNEKALIVTKAPKKEEGNKTLKIGDEMWQYLKNTETTIKIPPSMMLQSWNGSDFTNDDLVRESNLTEDYKIEKVAEEKIDGVDTWKLKLTPEEDAPVVWGKLYYWVRKKDFLPAVIEYFDEKGNKVRYMNYSDIKNFNGHTLPAEWTMNDISEEGEYTTIKIIDIEFDVNIPPRKFSYQELERGN